MRPGYIITALDIGTTKICAIIAEVTKEMSLEVKGIGTGPSVGLLNGIVIDTVKVTKAVEAVLEQAETMANISAKNIFVGIAGKHISSENTIGQISLSTDNTPMEITEEHIENVKTNAKNNVKIKKDERKKEIIHAIPQYYEIDGRSGIMNPINMSGFNLKAFVHVVSADITAIQTIKKCVSMAGYKIDEIILEPIASSFSVLNKVEKKLGSILIDIGGGTTDIAVFNKDSIRFSAVIPYGGTNITYDLTMGLRASPAEAEHIKITYGNCIANTVPQEKIIEIEGIAGREPKQKKLRYVSEIIEARMREILDMAYNLLNKNNNLKMITAGLTLTGGASLLKNLEFLAEEIFNMSTKIGYPNLENLKGPTEGLYHPKFATSVGILYYAFFILEEDDNKIQNYLSKDPIAKFFNKIIKSIKEKL